jgi:hypothetical protein
MVPDGVSSGGDLWLSIRREAETALACDPIFGRSLSASILDHPGLGAAVSHQIGQRLGKPSAIDISLSVPPMKHSRLHPISLMPRAAILK